MPLYGQWLLKRIEMQNTTLVGALEVWFKVILAELTNS